MRRDDHHGAAGGQGQGPRRQSAAASSACAAGSRRSTPKTGKIVWKAYNTGPGQGRADRPATSSRSTQQDRGKDLGVTTWPPEPGRSAAAPSGAGSPTTPSSNLIYYGTGNPGPWNPEQRPGRQQVDRRHLRPRRRHRRRRAGSTSGARTTSTTTTASTRTSCSTCDRQAAAAQGARPPRAQRLPLRARPRDGRGALGQRRSSDQHAVKGVDLKTGELQSQRRKRSRRRGKVDARHLPRRAGRQGLAALGLLAAHRPALHPAQEPLHGLRGRRGELHRRHALCRRRTSRYTAGPGGNRGEFTAWDPVSGKAVWKIKENFPVWSGALATAGDVVFYGTMEGWFKAVDARDGRGAVAVQDRLAGSSASRSPTAARTASSTSPSSPASAAGPAPSSPATSTRATPRPRNGWVSAMQDLPRRHDEGRARSMSSRCRERVLASPLPAARWRAPQAAGARAAGLRRPQQPAVLEPGGARASRTRSWQIAGTGPRRRL